MHSCTFSVSVGRDSGVCYVITLSQSILRFLMFAFILFSSEFLVSFFLLKILFIIFRQWGGREKQMERNINEWLPLMRPPPATWSTIQACALTGNWTSDPLVHRLVFNPLSHTSQVLVYHSLKAGAVLEELLCVHRQGTWQQDIHKLWWIQELWIMHDQDWIIQ